MLIKWYELNKDEFEQYINNAVVAINFASTEQHSTYLPVGTDGFLGESVLLEGARKARTPVLTLPNVYYGYSPHHRFAPGYLTIGQNTLISYAKNICACVADQGFKKMVIVNSHGGNQNYLSCAVSEVGEEYENILQLVEFKYWDLISETIAQYRESTTSGMGHAGEFETSVMLHLRPDLVRKDKIFECEAPVGNEWYQPGLISKKKYIKFESFNRYNDNGNIGQPHLASAEKGRLFFEAATDKLAEFFDYFAQNQP